EGGEAADALGRREPALILLDPCDGKTDGFRFLELLRRHPRWKELPVIILTNVFDRAAILRAGSLGVRDYMLKPRFSLAELLTRVQKYVRSDKAAAPSAIRSAIAAANAEAASISEVESRAHSDT